MGGFLRLTSGAIFHHTAFTNTNLWEKVTLTQCLHSSCGSFQDGFASLDTIHRTEEVTRRLLLNHFPPGRRIDGTHPPF